MKKKIIFFIMLFVFVSLNVQANGLYINGRNYDTIENFNGEGFKYYTESNILELNGYDGGKISKQGVLNILIKGTNYIEDNSGVINGTNITIYGDGTLNLKTSGTAINASSIDISNINLNGESEGDFFYGTSININFGILNIKCNNRVVMNGGDIYLGNSTMVVESYYGIELNYDKTINLDNSFLDVKSNYECIKSNNKLYAYNSNIYLHSNLSSALYYDNILMENQYNMVTVSSNGLSYQDRMPISSDKYVLISPILRDLMDIIENDDDIGVNNDKNNTIDNNVNENNTSINSDSDNKNDEITDNSLKNESKNSDTDINSKKIIQKNTDVITKKNSNKPTSSVLIEEKPHYTESFLTENTNYMVNMTKDNNSHWLIISIVIIILFVLLLYLTLRKLKKYG